MLAYVCRYRKYYPSDSREDVWCEIPMQEGYAMIAGAMTLDGWLQFGGMQIEGGYIKQECDRMMQNRNK